MLKLKDMKEMYEAMDNEEKQEVKKAFIDGVKDGCMCVGAGVIVKGLVKAVTGSDLISDIAYLATSGSLFIKTFKDEVEKLDE